MRKGFTLIELLVVISIIALLSSVVLASLNAARDKARLAAAKQFAGQTDRIIGDDAIGVWSFDECSGTAAIDRSGNGNDGALTGMATSSWSSDTPSGTGCSLVFDGSSDYVDVGNGSQVQVTTGTISAWIKTANAGAGSRGILVKKEAYGIFMDNNELTLYDWVIGTHRRTGARLSDGQWHHVACSFQSAVANGTTCYVDGRAVMTVTYNVNAQTSPLQIGWADHLVQYFTGRIDEPRLYSRVVTAAEIGQMYAQGIGARPLADNSGE